MGTGKKKRERTFIEKWSSCKWLITVWACGLLTYIVVAGKTDFVQLGTVLASAPLAYCITNVQQKKIYAQLEGEENDLQ